MVDETLFVGESLIAFFTVEGWAGWGGFWGSVLVGGVIAEEAWVWGSSR